MNKSKKYLLTGIIVLAILLAASIGFNVAMIFVNRESITDASSSEESIIETEAETTTETETTAEETTETVLETTKAPETTKEPETKEETSVEEIENYDAEGDPDVYYWYDPGEYGPGTFEEMCFFGHFQGIHTDVDSGEECSFEGEYCPYCDALYLYEQ